MHHGTVQEGNARITLDGSTALDKGNFTENSQFQLQAAIHDGDITELQHAFGTDYKVSGKLNLTRASGG